MKVRIHPINKVNNRKFSFVVIELDKVSAIECLDDEEFYVIVDGCRYQLNAAELSVLLGKIKD